MREVLWVPCKELANKSCLITALFCLSSLQAHVTSCRLHMTTTVPIHLGLDSRQSFIMMLQLNLIKDVLQNGSTEWISHSKIHTNFQQCNLKFKKF